MNDRGLFRAKVCEVLKFKARRLKSTLLIIAPGVEMAGAGGVGGVVFLRTSKADRLKPVLLFFEGRWK